MILPVIVLLLKGALSLASEVRYDFYRMYQVSPTTPGHRELLQEMQSTSDSLIFLHHTINSAKIIVAPHKYSDFESLLTRSAVKFELNTENVQQLIDAERIRFLEARSDVFNWMEYQKLPEINKWLYEQATLHSKVATVEIVGKTHEKRDILALKISHRPGNKAIFIEAGMHAREWISPAVATFFINELLNNNNSTDIQFLSMNFDWYFVVNANPDGYVYTDKNRFWRKTRKPYRSCFGADPNRNFDIGWGSVGVSKNPCHDIFAGSNANSESEVQSLTNYISRIKDLRLYISMHSYSQVLLLPYGYTEDVPDNNEDLQEIAHNTVSALSKRYGTHYNYGNIHEIMYPASGSSVDWVRDKTNTDLSFCYELRPAWGSGAAGFELPPEEIIPTSEETIDSIQAMIKTSVDLGYFY